MANSHAIYFSSVKFYFFSGIQFQAPCRAMYLLWVYILAPWFFAQPDETEMDPKKQRKMEKKMKRAGMM